MKQKTQRNLFVLIALVLFLAFGGVLLMYVLPMEDVSLDLSLGIGGTGKNDPLDPEDYDSKGWTVYTREGDTITELTPDWLGGYTGLALGQTFYFSRVMEEELDSPTLQLDPAECTFSIWLDDALLYTDCPGLDNRIGYVTLPMNGWYRSEPIIISLPMDYQGKTLTIAQSFPEWSETSSVRAWPLPVRLYCGYAYESGLISESFAVALISAALFLLGLVLLAAAVLSRDLGVLCLSLAAFLLMTQWLVSTSFFWEYYGANRNQAAYVLPLLSAGALFVFLSMRGGKHRRLIGSLTGIYLLSVVASGMLLLLMPTISADSAVIFFMNNLPFWLGFACIVAVLVLGAAFWRKENSFYRLFMPLALGGIALYYLAVALIFERDVVGEQLLNMLQNHDVNWLYHRTIPAVTAAALITAVVEAVRQEISRRVEKAAMEERRDMTLNSYETMRRQNEEVMMIRHDMVGHFEALREIADDPAQVTAYLDRLIGKNQKIGAVVQTGNRMLDVILNNTLSHAADKRIRVEIVKASAPGRLPLSDTDLCSLVMNIMSNAVNEAASCGADAPYIRLDVHVKNDYFALSCENSADMTKSKAIEKAQTVPRHGLGQKIIRNIVQQYSGLVETEYTDRTYTVEIAIPLFEVSSVSG